VVVVPAGATITGGTIAGKTAAGATAAGATTIGATAGVVLELAGVGSTIGMAAVLLDVSAAFQKTKQVSRSQVKTMT
jgi:hypothetical protein